MAHIEEKDTGDKKKGKPKKMSIHVDFTPMVDMNMLLLCFFMLCTSMIKPQTMEISMPSKDKIENIDDAPKTKESLTTTLILAGENKLYYYQGIPKFDDYTSLKETTYEADGLRAILLKSNAVVVKQINELKEERRTNAAMADSTYKNRVSEIKKDQNGAVVIIKAMDAASYENLIGALDEMQICNIGKYFIVDYTPGDKFLVENFESKGAMTQNIDTTKKK